MHLTLNYGFCPKTIMYTKIELVFSLNWRKLLQWRNVCDGANYRNGLFLEVLRSRMMDGCASPVQILACSILRAMGL
ncbi:hypothetical protein MPTK1_3g17210 [Marchantia polymorpha subsp. ruderalis]|uniref:Uncharacterized protein n=2 Tax=Marchantia polymorpha TaxID=3197 RepID=A0AAF6B1R0_MARPO|nr:hypothetical protein MARPO_0039s0073 [Marchantia polymorpha]BBN05942.1 hypothetical protein Mp_3g17210 [Marchantia polymorpha subsp. ruderalis]PTQ40581.1 hypothetical protein MARPO_0039s0073 [Marchantia polymorpha]PTQ40582.1 hypothetical protein MARPO_0039s0073 [Marchantia polymorpha]BBN05943.1 hypothetical protein Mp_3g17210 [Marchantia polymorpha subsp. ruderalis]|eukprot:PTQ40580.1 hypothetical protein MARPO_0039s0073 [Marchantia polymorpha]